MQMMGKIRVIIAGDARRVGQEFRFALRLQVDKPHGIRVDVILRVWTIPVRRGHSSTAII